MRKVRYIALVRGWLHLLRRRLTVQTILAFWVIPDGIGRLNDRISRIHPARMLLAAVIVAAVATPMALWQQERARAGQFARAYRDLRTTSSSEIATLRYSMGNLLDEQAQLRELLLESGYAVYSENALAVAVTATGYSSTVIETDNTPFITASNTRTRDGIVAMSRDMLRRYNPEAPFDFGDIVHISGLGDFVVEDSMNPRWRRRVDVWFPSRPAAFEFGRHRVIVTKRLPDGTETAYNYSLPANLVGTAPPSAVNAP